MTKMGSGTLDLRSIASLAGRSAALFAGGMLALTLLMDQLHRWFGFGRKGHWELIPSAILIIGGLWFSFQFSMMYFARRRISGVEGVLDEASRNPELLSAPCFGFVAMEGNLFTGNQIFVIFVTPETLYAWRAQGSLGSVEPSVFASYAALLKDDAVTRDLATIKGLAELPGGFVLSRPSITSVDFTPKRKWGISTVRHSGRIFITSKSGYRREFILLGEVDGLVIQQKILGATDRSSSA